MRSWPGGWFRLRAGPAADAPARTRRRRSGRSPGTIRWVSMRWRDRSRSPLPACTLSVGRLRLTMPPVSAARRCRARKVVCQLSLLGADTFGLARAPAGFDPPVGGCQQAGEEQVRSAEFRIGAPAGFEPPSADADNRGFSRFEALTHSNWRARQDSNLRPQA